jgi:hypothetical protein
MFNHIRSAITKCQTYEYYNINGLVVNPIDWETLETAKGSDGHYIWVTVPNGGEQRLWRVPVIVSNAMAQGDFLLGDWTMGATIYDREQMDIRVSESHRGALRLRHRTAKSLHQRLVRRGLCLIRRNGVGHGGSPHFLKVYP